MEITPRERRFLSWMGVSVVLSGIGYFLALSGSSTPSTVGPTDSAALAEKRLARLRDTAATVPQKEKILKAVSDELAKRENGLIQADTAAQAQAQLLQIIDRLCVSQMIPIKQQELGGIAPLGDAYGQATVTVQFECPLEKLVNLLSDIAAQPQLLTTSDLQVQSANPKEKTINVRLSVAGVTPRKLVPEKPGKKGAGA